MRNFYQKQRRKIRPSIKIEKSNPRKKSNRKNWSQSQKLTQTKRGILLLSSKIQVKDFTISIKQKVYLNNYFQSYYFLPVVGMDWLNSVRSCWAFWVNGISSYWIFSLSKLSCLVSLVWISWTSCSLIWMYLLFLSKSFRNVISKESSSFNLSSKIGMSSSIC